MTYGVYHLQQRLDVGENAFSHKNDEIVLHQCGYQFVDLCVNVDGNYYCDLLLLQ